MSIFQHQSTQEEIESEGREGYTVERVDDSGPILVYLQGHSYPHKGLPTADAIWATNIVKRLALEYARIAWLFPKSALESFGRITKPIMSPYILKEEHQTDSTKAIYRMLLTFFTELEIQNSTSLAQTVSHIFEYDSAYRFRVQDLATETDSIRLCRNPQEEIRRLLAINKERDYTIVSRKFNRIAMLALLGLYITKVRRAFKKAIQNDFAQLHFDENDRYWASLKKDYKYNV